MSTTHHLTEDEWWARFQPRESENDTFGVVNYDYDTERDRRLLEQYHAKRQVWTYCYSGVGNPYIVQGLAWVNREFYIICEVPYNEGEDIEVDSPTFYCENCGHWFDDCNPDQESVRRASRDACTCVGCSPSPSTLDDHPS